MTCPHCATAITEDARCGCPVPAFYYMGIPVFRDPEARYPVLGVEWPMYRCALVPWNHEWV